jgi:hypothetical protein
MKTYWASGYIYIEREGEGERERVQTVNGVLICGRYFLDLGTS